LVSIALNHKQFTTLSKKKFSIHSVMYILQLKILSAILTERLLLLQ
jgi:hypothetical protein